MKKVFLSVAIIVAATLSAGAQVQYGVKGGLNIANLTGSSSDGASALVGLHLGGLASIRVTDMFHVQPELVFSTEGAKVQGGKLVFDYLNIPVLAKYTITDGLNIEGGPQFGFMLSADAKDNAGNSANISSSFKSLDLAFALGLSDAIADNIGVDVRYNIGLSNIVQNSSTGTLHSSVLQIGAFYLFNTK